MRIYDGSKADELYAALHEFTPANSDDLKQAIIFTDNSDAGGTKLFIIFYFHDGPEAPTTGPLAKFMDIESTLDTTKAQSYAELVSCTRAFGIGLRGS